MYIEFSNRKLSTRTWYNYYPSTIKEPKNSSSLHILSIVLWTFLSSIYCFVKSYETQNP